MDAQLTATNGRAARGELVSFVRFRRRTRRVEHGACGVVDGNVGEIELRKGVGDERIGFVGGVVAGADIERERERVIADVGRVMTSGAGALERGDGDGAERGIVVEATNVGDGERAGVEKRFAGGNFFAGRDAETLEGIVGRLQIRPGLEHGDGGGIERATVGIFAERIIGARIVGLLREVIGAALRTVDIEKTGLEIRGLGAVKAQFEIHDPLLLGERGWLGGLGVTVGSIDRLLHQVRSEVGHEGSFTIQRVGAGFATVEHDGAEEAQVGGGQRAAVDGDGLLAGGGVGDDGAAVWVVNSFDCELRAGRHREEDPNHSALEEQAVVGGITGGPSGAVRAVDCGEEWILAVGEEEASTDVLNAEAHGVAGLVAGAAGAAVGAEALEEGSVFTDGPVGVVGGNDAGGIEEREQIRDHRGRESAGEREKHRDHNPLSRADFCSTLQEGAENQRTPLIVLVCASVLCFGDFSIADWKPTPRASAYLLMRKVQAGWLTHF